MNRLSTPATRARINRLVHSVIDTVLPPVCAHCGRVGVLICPDCLALFQTIPEPICAVCGRMLKQGTSTGSESESLCQTCASQRPSVAEARAPFLYEEPLSGIIHRLKYDGQFALARPLGELLADRWPDWSEPVELIMPVPLHARRERQRGFNQAALLARHLSDAVGVPLEASAVRRARHTRPQVDLNPEERAANVAGAFMTTGHGMVDRHILLVDDVFTTGATMNATAEVLLAAGARRVSAYCVARVS